MSVTQQRKRAFLKVVVLGDSGVGKSSILNRYVNNSFDFRHKATIGSDFSSKEIEVDGVLGTLQIWDTAGQERFMSLGPAFYRGADACLLVFDITNKASFDHIASWFDEFQVQSSREPQVVLIGNKCDLEEQRQVTQRQALKWCESNSTDGQTTIQYYETSALKNTNLQAVFNDIARTGLDKKPEEDLFVPPTVSRVARPAGKKCKC